MGLNADEFLTTKEAPRGADLAGILAALLRQSAISIHQIDRIIIGTGPGSFTGLRVVLGFVHGLTFQLPLPIGSVGTMRAAACAEPARLIISPAGKGVHFAHAPIAQGGALEIVTDDFLRSYPGTIASLSLEESVQRLPNKTVYGCHIAAALLQSQEIVWSRTISEKLAITPNYLRPVAAKTIKERSRTAT